MPMFSTRAVTVSHRDSNRSTIQSGPAGCRADSHAWLPHPQRSARPPPSCAALHRLSAQPPPRLCSGPLAASGALSPSMSGLVCSTGRPEGSPVSLRPTARPGQVPRETGPGSLAESPRRGSRALQPPAQAQQRGGPRPPHRRWRRRPREQRPPGPRRRRRRRRNWGAGLRGRAPSSSPISPTPSIS